MYYHEKFLLQVDYIYIELYGAHFGLPSVWYIFYHTFILQWFDIMLNFMFNKPIVKGVCRLRACDEWMGV